MSGTDEDIHNALMDQIFMAFCSAKMMGIVDPVIHTVATSATIKAYLDAYKGVFITAIGLKPIKLMIGGSRLFIVESNEVWSYSRIMNAPK